MQMRGRKSFLVLFSKKGLLSSCESASGLSGIIPGSVLHPVFGEPLKAAVSAKASFSDRFFTWDSDWYDTVALHGYSWRGLSGGQQNVAFLPVWPLILRLAYWPAGVSTGRAFIAALSAALACGSIFAFAGLSGKLLSVRQAHWATAFYALSPAAGFMLQSYPVALVNLLAIACLAELLERRYWRAAMLSGVASGAAPLMAALSLTVILAAWLERKFNGEPALRLVLLGVAACSGLLAFMVWSLFTFGDPLVFVTAQEAWSSDYVAFLHRLSTFTKVGLVLPDLWQGMRGIHDAVVASGTGHGTYAEARFVHGLNALVTAAAIVSAGLALLVRPKWLAAYCGILISGYVWLIATKLGFTASPRLLYPAVPSFFGLAILLANRRVLPIACLAASTLMLAAQEWLLFSGYWLI